MALQPTVRVVNGKVQGAYASQAKNIEYNNSQSVEDALDILMKIGIKEIEVGTKRCNIGSDSPSTAVAFKNNHSEPPKIVLTNSNNPRIECGTINLTSTGFNIVCYYSSTSLAYIDWLAIWA